MTIPLGYSEIAMTWTGPAVPTGAVSVFGVDPAAGITDPLGIATAVRNAVTSSSLMDRLSSNVTITNIHCKNGPDSSGVFADLATSLVGASPGDSNPATAGLVNKTTALGGRKNRGRLFLPGLIEADVAQGGQITSTARTALQTQLTNFLTDLASSDVPMVILHTGIETPTLVTGLTLSSLLAVQHRRLRR
jgi:hypothetical protein